jgi:hypothetical protein
MLFVSIYPLRTVTVQDTSCAIPNCGISTRSSYDIFGQSPHNQVCLWNWSGVSGILV